MSTPVVVGVDGSAASDAAVDLAAREASLRHRPLRIVHSFGWPYLAVPFGPGPVEPDGGLFGMAEDIVDSAVARARAAQPAVPVAGEVVTGGPVAVLVDESRSAVLVVVGDRGLGGFSGLLAGSVAIHLTAHAACPVLVARGRPDPTGEILLGVDGSPASSPAVGFAFEEAALRGAAITALHAWTAPAVVGPGELVSLTYDLDRIEATEARVLAKALAGWHGKYPDVTVHRRLIQAPTRHTLIEATSRAQLAVAGARGHGGFTGLLLGSVSQALLHHATCPVATVHDHTSPA